MHELGMATAIVETAQRRTRGRSVARLRVQVGTMLRAEEDAMRMAFDLAGAGTELEGAVLDLVTVPASLACRSCGVEAEVVSAWPSCPDCGSGDVEVSGGETLLLESIEYREAG